MQEATETTFWRRVAILADLPRLAESFERIRVWLHRFPVPRVSPS
jgi:hypothetical protein